MEPEVRSLVRMGLIHVYPSICCRLQSFAGLPTLLGIISNSGQWATNLSVGEDASDHYVGLISVALK